MARSPRWQPPLDFGASTPKPETRIEYDRTTRKAARETAPVELPWTRRAEPAVPPLRARPPAGPPSLQRAWEGLLAEAGWGATLVPAHRALLEALVRDLELRPGVVEATVGAGRERPHRVQLRTGVLTPAEWARLVRHVVDAGGVEAMLEGLEKGELSLGLLDAFDACDLPLLPRHLFSLGVTCTCGGAKAPCDHVMATHLSLARRLGKEASRAIGLRGGDVADLKALAGRLRAERLAAAPVTAPDVDPWTSPRAFVMRELPPPGPRRPLPTVDGWRAPESLEAMAERIRRAKAGA